MRWLMTFLLGVVVGAGGLFVWLRQMPHETAPAVAANTGSLPAPAGPNLDGQLPPAPKVMPDLTELDLPLRPGGIDQSAASGVAAAPALPAGKLLVPVEGMALSQIHDTFDQPRGNERHHEALDIMAPRAPRYWPPPTASWSTCSPAKPAASPPTQSVRPGN